jgi:hypothetical protein
VKVTTIVMRNELRVHVMIGTPVSSVCPKIRCHTWVVNGSGMSVSGLFAASGSVLNEVAIWMKNG